MMDSSEKKERKRACFRRNALHEIVPSLIIVGVVGSNSENTAEGSVVSGFYKKLAIIFGRPSA
jgi:hypothetical protein